MQAKAASVFVIGIGNENNMNIDMMNAIATEPVVEHIKYASTVEGINKVSREMKKVNNFFGTFLLLIM